MGKKWSDQTSNHHVSIGHPIPISKWWNPSSHRNPRGKKGREGTADSSSAAGTRATVYVEEKVRPQRSNYDLRFFHTTPSLRFRLLFALFLPSNAYFECPLSNCRCKVRPRRVIVQTSGFIATLSTNLHEQTCVCTLSPLIPVRRARTSLHANIRCHQSCC